MHEKSRLGRFFIEDDNWHCLEIAEDGGTAAYSIHDGLFARNDGLRFHAAIIVERFRADARIYDTEEQQREEAPEPLVSEVFQESFDPIGDNTEALRKIKQWYIDWIANCQ